MSHIDTNVLSQVSEIDEIISTLKRSNAPTLVVEGKGDHVAFGEFEVENIGWGFTILPVKGVENVQKIIDNLSSIAHPALAFLMDRDCGVFPHVQINNQQANIFYTEGYSIENDLLRDGDAIRLLKRNELEKFKVELDHLVRFFSCAAACHLNNQPLYAISTKPERILEDNSTLKSEFATWIDQQEATIDPRILIAKEDPLKFVQGKSLLSLFIRHLSHRSRNSKYSSANLLELGSVARGAYLKRIEDDVLTYFRSLGVAPS